MRRHLLVLATALVCIAFGAVGSSAAAPASPFVGTWWAIDPGDGSLQQLTFGAGGAMFYRDSYATVCGGGVGFSMGTGTVNGNTWTGSEPTPPFICPGGTSVPNVPFVFTLAQDGSLIGTYGTWTRARP
jgi:hypothetical protein